MKVLDRPAIIAATVLTAALWLSGCGGAPQVAESSEDPAPLPTWSDFPGEEATITGILRGSGEDGGCLWLESADGARRAVLWPSGYGARYEPAVLLDEHGQVVAREGDRIEGGGGVYQEQAPRCATGDTVVRLRKITHVQTAD